MLHHHRSERAFLLGSSAAMALEAEVMAHLSPSRYGDRGQSWVRSVYLDTASRVLTRRVVADPHNSTKLRLRSYHGQQVGIAPGERDVWVEIKRRCGDQVTKCRFRTIYAAVPAVLRGGTLPYGVCDQDSYIAQSALRRIQAGRRLHATVCVDYVRRSYESADGALRITFDCDLGAARPPEGYPPCRARLSAGPGERLCLFPGTVLEVKLRSGAGGEPGWLTSLVAPLASSRFSKAAAALTVTGVAANSMARAIPA